MSTHDATGPGELARPQWRKSTRSGSNGGACVEVAELADGATAVRDSKNPDGAALIFTGGEWAAFTAGIRAGEFR